MPDGRPIDTAVAPAAAADEETIRRHAGWGLDLLNLWVANIQTGFGPFIAVYLTSQGWPQTDIGLALSLGTATAMASQLPAGAVVDAIRRKSAVAGISIIAFSASALLLALFPIPVFVYGAEVLHGFSSCTLGPAVAAISITIAGHKALGHRLGRNARFSSIGNGVGAALMGACGYYVSERSVFFLTAGLALPAVLAIWPMTRFDRITAPSKSQEGCFSLTQIGRVIADRRLLIFALCGLLYTLSDSAMLPLVGSALTKSAGAKANLLIAACIVLPQVIVTLLSPRFGDLAESSGRRLVLLIGFAMLPSRGLLFALVRSPELIVAAQLLNGIASASFLIMVPLVTADIAARSGHFNAAMGFVGFCIGVGGLFSTGLAGWIADVAGETAAFGGLAAIGVAGLALVWFAMPETRPAEPASKPA